MAPKLICRALNSDHVRSRGSYLLLLYMLSSLQARDSSFVGFAGGSYAGNRIMDFNSAGIFKQSMVARNRVGIGLSYRPARVHRLAELIPWN
jgi:hypothetical protein